MRIQRRPLPPSLSSRTRSQCLQVPRATWEEGESAGPQQGSSFLSLCVLAVARECGVAGSLARTCISLSHTHTHTHTCSHLLSLSSPPSLSRCLSLSLSPLSCLLTLTPAVCDLSSIFTNMSMSLSPHASAPSEVTPDASFTLIRRLPRMGKNTRSCVKMGTTSRHENGERRGEIPRREERGKEGGRVAPSISLTLLAVEGPGLGPGLIRETHHLGGWER